MSALTAQDIIRMLGLKPHPEGGHFRETFRDSMQAADGRAASTAAYYLLAREPAPSSIEHPAWEAKLTACKDRLEINIAKQRQGATGPVNCFTAIECNAFYSSQDGGAQRYGVAA